MSHKGFSPIGLSTLDLDKTRDFSENVLGFKAVRGYSVRRAGAQQGKGTSGAHSGSAALGKATQGTGQERKQPNLHSGMAKAQASPSPL